MRADDSARCLVANLVNRRVDARPVLCSDRAAGGIRGDRDRNSVGVESDDCLPAVRAPSTDKGRPLVESRLDKVHFLERARRGTVGARLVAFEAPDG
jgi:hypothetical protein